VIEALRDALGALPSERLAVEHQRVARASRLREQLSLLPANELGEVFPWQRVLRPRRHALVLDDEQSSALAELQWGTRLVGDDRIASIAAAMRRQAALPMPFADIRIVALSEGLELIPVNGMNVRDGGRILGRALYYAATTSRQQRTFRVGHELSHHGLRFDVHDHADVQALMAELLAPIAVVTRFRTVSELYRAARNVSTWILRLQFARATLLRQMEERAAVGL
jgi:hypothetical protein